MVGNTTATYTIASDTDDSDSDNDFERSSEVPRHLIAHPAALALDQIRMVYSTANPRDAGLLILDTACAMTVASNDWTAGCATVVATAYNINPHVQPEHETFAFGNCEPQGSEWLWYLPAMLEVASFVFSTSCLEGYFPLLFS